MGDSLLVRATRAVGAEEVYHALTPQQRLALCHEWRAWARPEQLAPGTPGASIARVDWRRWLILAGRGFGKTRTIAEWVRQRVESGKAGRIALVAPTAADARDVLVEGESGILAVSPPWNRPVYEPSKRRLTWPNGAIASTYSADEPERLRGPQHDAAAVDELAAWRYVEAWDQLQFGLRLGSDPRCVIATTPRPKKILRDLLLDPTVVVTRGRTTDNEANLAPAFLDQVVGRYRGTRLGRQELEAELLDDAPGALWSQAMIDASRIPARPLELARVVVAIDPQASAGTGSTDEPERPETGIVVAGVGLCGCRDRASPELHGFVLADGSGSYSPADWARRALALYDEHHADRLIGEQNNGGAMVENTIRTVRRNAPYEAVWASQGKRARAEPVAALYEQGKVHHVGTLDLLEDQLTSWEPLGGGPSPNRLDALVWALSRLMLVGEEATASIWARADF